MGNKLSCRICRRKRYWDNRKFFNEERLCKDCSVIMDFNVQFLVPVEERKTSSIFPRIAYKRLPKLQWYTFQKGPTDEYMQLRRIDDAL